MALAPIVATGSDAVVLAQLGVSLRQFLLLGQIVERRRQAVGTVLLGRAAGHPQGILQARGQRLEALAAEHHTRVTPAAVRERELVQAMRQRDATDTHAQLIGHGEVRQTEPSRRMFLGEEELALAAMLSTPLSNSPLQRAQQ